MAIWEIGAGKAPVNYSLNTGIQTTAKIAISGRCIFRGAVIKEDGATDVTVTFYDALEAGGTKILDTFTVYAGSGPLFIGDINKMCANGVYVDIAGGTFSWQVMYDQ